MTVAGGPCRVMIVDDSAVIRGLLSRALEEDPHVAIVASVGNGQMAVNEVGRREIDVVVLDIEMPVMDGLTALPKLLQKKPKLQVIVASTLTRKNAEISLKALRMGAADYVTKPSARSELHAADGFRRELCEKVKALGIKARGTALSARSAPVSGKAAAPATKSKPPAPPLRSAGVSLSPQILAIGSSTGGPQALFKVLGGLKDDLDIPVMVTQHMPATFTTLLAEHVNRVTGLPCSEAADGMQIKPGHVYIAPGDYHMTLDAATAIRTIRLNQDAPENFCRPSVDPMLRSLSKIYGARLLIVILTGMGSDGMRGSETAVQSGARVIAQDEATSVVWGMPGAVAQRGICSAILPLDEIAPYVRKLSLRSAA